MKSIFQRILGKIKMKKATSGVVIFTFLLQIISPGFHVFAGSLPSYDSVTKQANVVPVAQVQEISLPRDLGAGDILNLVVSGTVLSQHFDTDSLTTAELLNTKINLRPEVDSTFDSVHKKFILTSQVPGVAFYVSNLTITSDAIHPFQTVGNVVAVAQKSKVSIPQDLMAGDDIYFSINGLPLVESFSGSKDQTLDTFAQTITSSTPVIATYSGATGEIVLEAKVPGVDFSLSSFVVVSHGVSVLPVQPNIVPVAQVEAYSFPRNLYADEVLTLSLSGDTLLQPFSSDYTTTLQNLSAQVNALGYVTSNVSSGVLTLTAAQPGVPFSTGSLTITGAVMTGVTIIPNVTSVAQRNDISVPRDLFPGDTIHFDIGGTHLTQAFSGTSNDTILALNEQINTLPNVYVSAYNSILRNISLTAKTAGTGFANPTLFISSLVSSQPKVLNQAAGAQVSEVSFSRPLVSGDTLSTILNGSPYQMNFATGSQETKQAFVDLLAQSNSGVLQVSLLGDTVHIEAVTPGNAFNIQPLILENKITPVVLVPNVVPVKQTSQLSFAHALVSGDVVSVDVDGTQVTQNFDTDTFTTLQALNHQIDTLSTVDSTLSGTTLSVVAAQSGVAFSVGNVFTSGSQIPSVNIQAGINEIKPQLHFSFDQLTASGDFLNMGDCTIGFTQGSGNDFDCADNIAYIDTTSVSDISTLAALVKGVYSISQSGTLLSLSGTGGGIDVVAAQAQNANIAFAFSGGVSPLSVNSLTGQFAQAQRDTLTLPRDFALGDTFQLVVNGITVTQNYLSSSGVSFDNLITQIDALPGVSATGSNNVITIQADVNTSLSIGSAHFENTLAPLVVISNVVAVAEKKSIHFPIVLNSNDRIEISIDGQFLQSSGSLVDLAQVITSQTAVNASVLSGTDLILEAKTAGTSFGVENLKVTSSAGATPLSPNIVGVAQKDELTIPFALSATDELSVNINGTLVTQNYVTDDATTLSLLNTKINDIVGVDASVDVNTKTFTLVSENAGTPFTASLLATGTTILAQPDQPNVDSGSQVDSLSVSRELQLGDQLTLEIAGHTITQNFDTDKVTTLQALNTQVDNLSEVSSVYDGVSTLIISSTTPGEAFASGVLTIQTIYTSENKVQNVFAQAQIDKISVARNFILGDTISFVLNGTTYAQVFSGSHANTLADLLSKVNLAQTGVTLTSFGNDIIFTANVAGEAFSLGNFVVENASLSSEIQPNVVAVKQEMELSLPTFVPGDMISLTLNGTGITQPFVTSHLDSVDALIAGLMSAVPEVQVDYNGVTGKLHFISGVAGVPFTLSDLSVVNTTSPAQTVANVPAVAQITRFTPSGVLRGEIVFRTTIDGVDYDYMTASGDTLSDVVNGIASVISSTGVIVSTGSSFISGEYVDITAAQPGVPFTYASQVLDINPPIISTDTLVQETLKSGDISGGSVTLSENGDIYLVLSGTTITSSGDLVQALSSGSGFLALSGAVADTPYQITPAQGIVDGVYNLVAIDEYGNISQVIPGFITIDNTPPAVTLLTQSGMTLNSDTITIQGTTESNVGVQLVLGGQIITTTSDGAGSFSGTLTLNQNTQNLIDIIVTDSVGNITLQQITIYHDNLSPVLSSLVYPSHTNALTGSINIGSESGILAEVFAGVSVVASGMTNGSGEIALEVPLSLDSANNFQLVLTDLAGNYTTQTGMVIIQDSTAPNILLSPYLAVVHSGHIDISGTTEPGALVTITNSGVSFTGTADNSGVFSIQSLLTQTIGTQTINSLTLQAQDLAGNIFSTGITITEDSEANSLLIATPSQTTASATLSVTGTTKKGSHVDINGTVANVDGNGNFDALIALQPNTLNTILVTSTDVVANVVTGSIMVTHDDMAPSVQITTSNTPTNNTVINLVGLTEANTIVSITGGSGTFVGISGTGGDFNIPVTLQSGVMNNLLVSSQDLAGNIGTGSISIFQDPTFNFVQLSQTGIMYTNTDTFTLSGVTKPFANILVTGGSGIVSLTAQADGTFSTGILLSQNTSNSLVVASTDATLTTAQASLTVVHDTVKPTITNFIYPNLTNQPTVVLSGDTENQATLTADNGGTLVTAQATATGSFTLNFPLLSNTGNLIQLSLQDLAGNISTGSILIQQDSRAPVLSNISLNQNVVGNVMTLSYSFDTDEHAQATIMIGTGSNVDATLVASGTTLGLSHSGIISGFNATQTYYYYIVTSDTAGNVLQTAIGTIDTIPVILDLNSTTRLDISNLPLSYSGMILTGTTTVGSGFELMGETYPSDQFYFSFTGGLLSHILTGSLTLPQIVFTQPTNLYTTTGTIVFEKKAINGGEIISGNIKQIFSPAVTIGGVDTILLDAPAKVIFSGVDTSIVKFAYRKTGTSVWNIRNIESSECSVDYATKPVCAYKEGSSVVIKTLHFTDFALVVEQTIPPVTPTPTPVVSSGGGGGGGSILRDACPQGDYSPSYYDRTCGVKPSSEVISQANNVEQIITDSATVSQTKTSLSERLRIKLMNESKIKHVKYFNFDIVHIRGYADSQVTFKLALAIARDTNLDYATKVKYINIINEFIVSKYNLSVAQIKYQTIKNKYTKQSILLKSVLKSIEK